jgi:hypothetical protein
MLNAVPLTSLLALMWHWARPKAAAAPPQPKPLLSAAPARALACWTAVQLVCSYLLQIPQLAHTVGSSAARTLNIGLFSYLSTFQEEVLLAMHLLALVVLYLVLNGLRCTCDSNTRCWPPIDDIIDSARALVNAHVQARQQPAAAVARAAAAQHSALLSPIIDQLPSIECHDAAGVLRSSAPPERDIHDDMPPWLDPAVHPPEWIWTSGQAVPRHEDGHVAQWPPQSSGTPGQLDGGCLGKRLVNGSIHTYSPTLLFNHLNE